MNKLVALSAFLCGTVFLTTATESGYPNPGDLVRVVKNFGYDRNDIGGIGVYGVQPSKVEVGRACRKFHDVAYGYGDDILKECTGNKKYLVVFTGEIQSNKISSTGKFCEILTKGNGFCFWNSAFGFDLEDPEFRKHMKSIASEQLGIEPIEGKLFNIDRSDAPDAPDTKSISACKKILTGIDDAMGKDTGGKLPGDIPSLNKARKVVEAIICEDKDKAVETIMPFIQNASEVESVVQALEKFENITDTDKVLLDTVSDVIKFIRKVTIYGSGIDMEEAEKVLEDSSYHFAKLDSRDNEKSIEEKSIENSEKGKPILLWFDFGAAHFSRLILKSELDDLRKAAKQKKIEVIEYKV